MRNGEGDEKVGAVAVVEADIPHIDQPRLGCLVAVTG
jgi:hypothetical protein